MVKQFGLGRGFRFGFGMINRDDLGDGVERGGIVLLDLGKFLRCPAHGG